MRYFFTVFLLIAGLSYISLSADQETKPPSPPAEQSKSKITAGEWVRYRIKRQEQEKGDSDPSGILGTSGELLSEATAELKISITGKQTLYDQEYFWVEYVINEGAESQRIVKILVDDNGIPQAEKVIAKHGLMPAVEMNLRLWEVKTRITREKLLDDMMSKFNLIPLTRRVTPTPDKTDILPEKSISVTITSKPDIKSLACFNLITSRPEIGLSSESFYAKEIPLAGLAMLEMIQGSATKETRTIISIIDFGVTGAESLITKKPKQLDFK